MERTQNSESITVALSTFVDTLNDRQADILRGRVINDLLGEDQRCAKTFGVSKQRVGQIEKQLRGKLAAHFTRSFGPDGVKAGKHHPRALNVRKGRGRKPRRQQAKHLRWRTE